MRMNVHHHAGQIHPGGGTGIDRGCVKKDDAVQIGFPDLLLDALFRDGRIHQKADIVVAFRQFRRNAAEGAPEVRAVVEGVPFVQLDADQRIPGLRLKNKMAQRIGHRRRTLAADQIALLKKFLKCQLDRAPRDAELFGQLPCRRYLDGFPAAVVDQIHDVVANPHLLGQIVFPGRSRHVESSFFLGPVSVQF